MAKKTATKRAVKKTAAKRPRKAAKRDLVRATNATFFAKRDDQGEYKEMDEMGRSLKADRARTARTAVKSGFGDQGDQPKRKQTAKKR